MKREKIEKRLAMNMLMAEKIEEKRKQDFMEKQVRVCCMGKAGEGVLYVGGGGGCVVWGGCGAGRL